MSHIERAKGVKEVQREWGNRAVGQIADVATPSAGRAATKTARPRQSYNADEDSDGDAEEDGQEDTISSPPKPSHKASGSVPSRASALDTDADEADSRPAVAHKVLRTAPAPLASRASSTIDDEEADPRPAAVSRKASGSAPSRKAFDVDEEETDPRPPANPRKVSSSAPARAASRPPPAQLYTIKDEGIGHSVATRKATNAKPPSPDIIFIDSDSDDSPPSQAFNTYSQEADVRPSVARKASRAPAQAFGVDDDGAHRSLLTARKASGSAPSRAPSGKAFDIDEEEADPRPPANPRKVSGSAPARAASRAPSVRLPTIKDEEIERSVTNPRKATDTKSPPPKADIIVIDSDSDDAAPPTKSATEPSAGPRARNPSGTAATLARKPSASIAPTTRKPSAAQSRASSTQSGEGGQPSHDAGHLSEVQGEADQQASGTRRAVKFPSKEAERWFRDQVSNLNLRRITPGQTVSAWIKGEVLPEFYKRWPLPADKSQKDEDGRYYRWALRTSNMEPPTTLDKTRTPMQFPAGAKVFYHRPKKASAKELMADANENLVADFHNKALKLLQAKDATKEPRPCHVYLKAVNLAWDSLTPEKRSDYLSLAERNRTEPEDLRDKVKFLHLLPSSAQMYLWSTQARCPDGWSFSLIAAGPDPEDPDGRIISWNLDMPPLGADGSFSAYKADGFDYEKNVGIPFADFNVKAQKQRKKDGVGEFADVGEIDGGRPRIAPCDGDWEASRLRTELRHHIEALYMYSRTPIMVEAKERLSWEALFADPSAHLTPSSIPKGIKFGAIEAMKMTDAAILYKHIEASDEAEEPFFGFIFEKRADSDASASSAGRMGGENGNGAKEVIDMDQEGSDGGEVIDLDLEDSDGREGGGDNEAEEGEEVNKEAVAKGKRDISKKASKPTPAPTLKASKKLEKVVERSEEEEEEEELPAKKKRGATTKAIEPQTAKKNTKKNKAAKALDEEAADAAEVGEDGEGEGEGPAKAKQGARTQTKKPGPAARKAPQAKAASKGKSKAPEEGDEEGEEEEGEEEEEPSAKPKRGRKKQTTKPGPAATKAAPTAKSKPGKRKAAMLTSDGEEDAEEVVERPPAKKRAGKKAVAEAEPTPEPAKSKARRAPAKGKAPAAKKPEREEGMRKSVRAVKPPRRADQTPEKKTEEADAK